MTRSALLVLAPFLLLAACGGKTPPELPAPADPAPAARPEPPAPAPAPVADDAEARRRAEELAAARATLESMVFFGFDQSEIDAAARATMEAKVPLLRASPAARLRIEGHADERGSDEYNLALGMRRAAAAKRFLVGAGLDPARFETVSYGEERPLQVGSTEETWARNRRAEFRVLDLEMAGH
jgi:peptidoglycan-associated lipoprotein